VSGLVFCLSSYKGLIDLLIPTSLPKISSEEKVNVVNEKLNGDRLMDIEIKIARQEDLLDTLNQMVYQQQTKIDQLEKMFNALAAHLKAMPSGEGDVSPANEKPPHY
jgi:SlyX protein